MVLTFFKLKKRAFQQDQACLIWSSFGWSSSAHKFGYQNAGQFWTVSTLWPITFERLIQMQWNHIPWKLDILSCPMNQESSNLDPKPESYACLKLGLLLMWMHLMQNAWRCVKACDFGSCCLYLLIKRVLPLQIRLGCVIMVGYMHPFCCHTHFTPTTPKDTPLRLCSSECSMLFLFTSFHLFYMSFHCVRPLLYKGHSIRIISIQSTFEIYEILWVRKLSPLKFLVLYLEFGNSSGSLGSFYFN